MSVGEIFVTLFLVFFVLIPTLIALVEWNTGQIDAQTALVEANKIPLADNPNLFLLVFFGLFIVAVVIYTFKRN